MGINLWKASPSQPAKLERLPKGEQLNDSVYLLYTPQCAPEVVVVFFHGLPQEDDYTEAYWKTWLSRDVSRGGTIVPTVIWPKEWLPERLRNPQILSVSYDSKPRKHDGASDSYTIAENLISDLILSDARVGQDCPVVLVGHSLGGIIIKEVLLACLRRRGELCNSAMAKPQIELIDNFLENCKGVFYFSTPHSGSEFIEYLKKNRVPLNGPLMKLMKVLSSETARINSEFSNARVGEGIRTQAIVENADTTYMGFKGQIVKEASARHDITSFYTAVNADHFDVCKPKNNKSCSIFTNLLGFINAAMKDKGPGLRATVPPEGYVPKANKARTCHPASPERGTPEINPRRTKIKQLPTEIDQRTEGIKKLNDSVYQLYSPQGVPRVVVVFFHGLPQEDDYREAYWKTWLSRDVSGGETVNPPVVWPKEWLPERLLSPQILSVSYDSYAPNHDGASDSYVIAENLISDLILGDVRLGQDCPVVLVGHSLGGIIIKELLLTCFKKRGQLLKTERARPDVERIENFLKNCKGVFYYSTPHNGSKFIDYLERSRVPLNAPLMELLKILSSKTARINSAFAKARYGEEIRTQAIVENRDTIYMGFKGQIVGEASARCDIDVANFYTAVDANHFEVCKPRNKKSCNIFKNLVGFIQTAIEDKGPGFRARLL